MASQTFQTNQQGISGKRRNGRVRRIAVAQRAERKNLPKSLPRRCERIDKLVRGRTKITNAAARRQRRGMQQNTCSARKQHATRSLPRIPNLLNHYLSSRAKRATLVLACTNGTGLRSRLAPGYV